MSITRKFIDISVNELRSLVKYSYNLSMEILQSDLYQRNSSIKCSVDAILDITMTKKEELEERGVYVELAEGEVKRRSKMSEQFIVYFSDLNDDVKREFLKFQNLEKPEDGNYDVNPIFVLEKGEED